MHIHNFFFPDELFNKLKNLSEETGAPVSELVRRACKEYIEKREHDKKTKK
jgi:predicted DNA-binding protein